MRDTSKMHPADGGVEAAEVINRLLLRLAKVAGVEWEPPVPGVSLWRDVLASVEDLDAKTAHLDP